MVVVDYTLLEQQIIESLAQYALDMVPATGGTLDPSQRALLNSIRGKAILNQNADID